MTKGQAAYTERFVDVQQTDMDLRRGEYTLYLVTANALMATRSRRVIQRRIKSWSDAQGIARGYSESSGIKMSRYLRESI